MPSPPNLVMRLQFLHVPQSFLRHFSHFLQRVILFLMPSFVSVVSFLLAVVFEVPGKVFFSLLAVGLVSSLWSRMVLTSLYLC